VKTIYSLPEQVLDVLVTANESIQTKWTVWDTEVDGKPFHMDVIRNQITRNLGLLTRPIAAEIDFAFKREWGTSTTQWKLIDPWPSALRIVAGAANAAFCGPALCWYPAPLLPHHQLQSDNIAQPKAEMMLSWSVWGRTLCACLAVRS
jgi:hypothetical protein